MPRVRLKIGPIPELSALSSAYPGTVVRILFGFPTDDGVRSLFEVRTPEPERLADDLPSILPVHSMDVLHRESDAFVALVDGEPPTAYNVAEDIEQFSPKPIVLREGHLYNELVLSHDALQDMSDSLRKHDVDYEVLSVSEGYELQDLLTDRQRDVLAVAVRHGYYEDPRRCTLSDVADSLGVSKSAASGTLRRAENAIVHEVIGDPELFPTR